MDIKLVSWNIWGGMFLPAVSDFLKSSRPDIIALQEVEETDEYVNTASILADALDYEYVYTRSMEYEFRGKKSFRGNAVLSRHHIAGSRPHQLSEGHTRTAMLADILVNDVVLHIVSVHIAHDAMQPSPVQEEQIRTLLDVVPKERSVIMGDFNAVPESQAIAHMSSVFQDTDEKKLSSWCLYPDGPELPKPEAVTSKIDYIFVSPGMNTHDFTVGESTGSDHLPLSVILRVV